MKVLTAEQRNERLKTYREILADWEEARRISDAAADELTQDIRDLECWMNTIKPSWESGDGIPSVKVKRAGFHKAGQYGKRL